jgi:hypothetical protein
MKHAFVILAGLTVGSAPADAKTWAAQFPLLSGELSPVFHARSADEAVTQAKNFCRETEICRNQFPNGEIRAVTAIGVVGSSNLFVTTACRQESGENVYVIGPSLYDGMAGREDGMKKGKEALQQAGYSIDHCTLHAVYGVKSRDRLSTDLTEQAPEQDTQTLKGQIRRYKVQRRNATYTAVEILD